MSQGLFLFMFSFRAAAVVGLAVFVVELRRSCGGLTRSVKSAGSQDRCLDSCLWGDSCSFSVNT